MAVHILMCKWYDEKNGRYLILPARYEDMGEKAREKLRELGYEVLHKSTRDLPNYTIVRTEDGEPIKFVVLYRT